LVGLRKALRLETLDHAVTNEIVHDMTRQLDLIAALEDADGEATRGRLFRVVLSPPSDDQPHANSILLLPVRGDETSKPFRVDRPNRHPDTIERLRRLLLRGRHVPLARVACRDRGVTFSTNMSLPEDAGYDVELGPFFALGVIVLAYGLLRRKPLAVVAGIGAIWLDNAQSSAAV
jgi:hypothetical protein